MFSDLANDFQGETNPLYRERNALQARGEKIIDLVSGNVHHHDLVYPQGTLERALQEGARLAQTYRPDPLGQQTAREAISRSYLNEGLSIPPEQILLTPGTSLSYWYAFRLLADPGDEILSPRPSYPLFDAIATLAGVRMIGYRLREGARWEIDFDQLESQITPRSRAIILISPHNPTGAVATETEIARIAEIAGRHQLAIISDEVFSPFLFKEHRLPRPAAADGPLVLTLNGFSKMFALPGMKIGWMAVTGRAPEVEKAMMALETISDTFLPVNEAAQFAIPAIFEGGKTFSAEYQAAIAERAQRAVRILSPSRRLSLIPPEGGFYATLRLNNSNADEEEIALELLRRERILVHPGYFYDLDPAHLILSFVSAPPLLEEALNRLNVFINSGSHL
ncbi:MAG: pyridoxal phosphate-dependent aminotransferase [Nitrospirae bacterium]|nr:pyridoxal phosphate-dependent aminotransferase [Candidatus Manganitrophaceae bacterium]